MPAGDCIVLQPEMLVKPASDPSPWTNGLYIDGIPNPQYVRSDSVVINVWGVKDYKFIDHYQYTYQYNMSPSGMMMVVNSITSSSLEEGHTNVTITFDLTLANLME